MYVDDNTCPVDMYYPTPSFSPSPLVALALFAAPGRLCAMNAHALNMNTDQTFGLAEVAQVDDPTDMVSYAVSKSADMVANTAIKSARLLGNNLAKLDLRAGIPAWIRNPTLQAEEKLHPLVMRYWQIVLRIEGTARDVAKAEMDGEDARIVVKFRDILQRYDNEANRLLGQMHEMTDKTASSVMNTKLRLLKHAPTQKASSEDPKELIAEMVGALVGMGIVPADKHADALKALGAQATSTQGDATCT